MTSGLSKSTKVASEVATPFLRWAGSKRSVLAHLRCVLPKKFGKYIEPFAGSACLFFRTAPQRAVLSDLNGELIETYETVRERPVQVGNALREMPVGRNEFYFVRAVDPAALSGVDRATRFIYLNRFCFNGLYRTNTAGRFNVPYGAPKNHAVPSCADLQLCAQRLSRAELIAGDFEDVVRRTASRGDFVYLDPPFFCRTTRVFREYNAKPFASDDLNRLVRLLHWLNAKEISFCVSYALTEEARSAFAGWKSFCISTNRNISGFAQHRRKADELVITNADRLKRT